MHEFKFYGHFKFKFNYILYRLLIHVVIYSVHGGTMH